MTIERFAPLAGLLAALLTVPLLATTAAAAPDETVRYAGTNRYATAADASKATFDPGVAHVLLATGRAFPDALAAGAVAGPLGAPVLLVEPTRLPQSTRDELVRLDPGAVTVLGGTTAVSDAVLDEVRATVAAPVDRIAGPSRHATAAAVSAAFVDRPVEVAYVATGATFADALAGGPAAAEDGGPLLLVSRAAVPAETRDELARLQPARIVVLGGTAAVSDAVVTELEALTDGDVIRRAGPDRYATAAAVVAGSFPGAVVDVVLGTGADFPDALAGGAVAAHLGGPLLITDPACVPDAVRREIDRLDPTRLVVLGGTSAVSEAAAALTACAPPEPDPDPPVSPIASIVQGGLDTPWDIARTPDGRTFLTERDSGRLLQRHDDGTLVEVARFDVDAAGEGGLLGLAHSPDFLVDGLLYVFLTTTGDNRIVRIDPNTGDQALVLSGIPDNTFHDGGRITFGPDGMLWVGTGDAGVPQRAQDLGSLAGKILRLTPEGGIPGDNPFPGSPVWAYGFRNPQGLAFDASGRLYASEIGPDRDDEINLVVPGGNFAWGSDPGGQSDQPTGVTGNPAFVDPIVVRQPSEASWSGATVLRGGTIPQWEGDLFVAALRGERLYRIDLDPGSGGVLGVEELLVGEHGRLRQVTRAPDGSLWILTSNCDGRGSCPASGDHIVRLGPP